MVVLGTSRPPSRMSFDVFLFPFFFLLVFLFASADERSWLCR